MIVVEKLVNTLGNKRIGNHAVEVHPDVRYYRYFGTTIAFEYPSTRQFYIDSSYGTQSTTRACNAYRREFISQGYEELDTKLC